ncbi:translocation/assembly module TamB domain-containing protein [Viscerimonas tarda]
MPEGEKDITPPQKNSLLKKILKITCRILLGIVGLHVLLYVLLSIPAVQEKVIDFAISKIKPLVNTEISIDKVQIGLFNSIRLQGVYIEDRSKDTLLYATKLELKFNLWKLINNELQINAVKLDNAAINISQASPGSTFNFQFLIDAFASSDTVPKPVSNPMKINIGDIRIQNTRINYDVLSELQTPDTFNVSHLSVNELNAELAVIVDAGNFEISSKSLSLKEKSGLTITNLEGEVQLKAFKLESKKIALQLPSSTLEISELNHNLITKDLNLQLKSAILPKDLLPLMPQLKSLKNELALNAKISGKRSALNVERLSLNYGEDLDLQANASIDGWQDYGQSKINLSINNFRVSPKAIEQLARIGDSTYVNPGIFSSIDYFHLKGSMDGRLNNMNIAADAWTNQGAIQLTGHVATDTTFADFKLKASLRTQNFNLIPFVGKDAGLKKLSMYVNIDLASIKDLKLKLDGAIDAIQYQESTVKDIRFKGKYDPAGISAWLYTNLPMGKILAEGSMTQGRNPEIKFNLKLHNLKTDHFYKNTAWENPQLTLSLNGDLKGNNINDIQGQVVIDTLRLWGTGFDYKPGKFSLESGINQEASRYITLKSPLLDANITGEYDFMRLYDELENRMHAYLPNFFAENKKLKKYRNNFEMDIVVKNSEDIGRLFALPVTVVQQANIKAGINTIDNRISLTGDMPYIRYGENEIKGIALTIDNSLSAVNINAKANLLQEGGSIGADVGIIISNDTIAALLTVKNNQSAVDINGQLKACAHFENEDKERISYLNILPTTLNSGALNFAILPAAISNYAGRTTISNAGISLNGRKYFGIDGIVSESKEDSVRLYFNQAQIGDILTAFDLNSIRAEANGGIVVTNVLAQPELYTRGLNLANIVIFGDSLGTLDVRSEWNNIQQAILFDASLKKNSLASNINGYVSTSKDSMNVNINLEKLSLKWLQPFMSDLLNKVSGSISAKMSLVGETSSPITKGWIGFNDMDIGVDFTNVTYHISDTIKVFPDRIGFRDLQVMDNNKNIAVASALISHKKFKDFGYLLNLDLKNFMILNTGNRTDSLFYGKLMTSGNIKANGNNQQMNVTMDVKSEKNSSINITLPNVSEASDYQSIVYINVPQQDTTKTFVEPVAAATLPLNLDMNIELTPSITLGVIINPATGDAMHVKGAGKIKFNYDLQADKQTAYGEYTLSDGNVKLKLQNLAALEFKIQEGSKLNFIGDPMRTTFNITAYRRVRADLQKLDDAFTSASKVNVDCVLGIKGNIQKMELTYNISLPDADDDTQRKLQSIINTDDEKIKNFASLIATGSFYSSHGNVDFTNNMLTSVASGALSGLLNATFRNIMGDKWEIGTDISSQDGSFSDVDMSVNVSTRLFNDKLKLNTNLGYRTDQTVTSENTFIGDFDIEYELSKLWQLKAYNKTNNQFYRQAPTTQGIGIIYTKEAKTLKLLFRSFRRRTETPNAE